MPHPGDPTPRSAREVLADPSYRMVVSEQVPLLDGQFTNTMVVQHCGTESYWQASYPTTAPDVAATWRQVAPVVETRTTYRPVPG